MSYRLQILHGSSYGQSEQILTKFWKTKWPPNHKVEHNSLISWQNFKKQNGRQIAKLSITCSFLELQSPDFVWQFVWTVRTNFENFLKNKMAARFRMEVCMDSLNEFWFLFLKNKRASKNKMAAKSQYWSYLTQLSN